MRLTNREKQVMRDTFPYGYWINAAGEYEFFRRDYRSLGTALFTTQVKDSKQVWFFNDDSAPWLSVKEYRTYVKTLLSLGFRAFFLPRIEGRSIIAHRPVLHKGADLL